MSERRIPGRAGELLAQLGERAVLHDLYDEVGSAVYHDMAGRDQHEVRELLGLVRRTPGPVLDLAAGSGRLTLPLLAMGREVTALDLSRSMLALLRERLAQAPAPLAERCTVVQGDMSDFSLHRRFPVIVLGTTSVSLLDQAGRARLFASVRAHLEPGGRFLLTTVDADPGYTGPPEIEQTYTTSGGTDYRIFDHWVPGDAVRTVTIFPAHPADGPTAVCTSNVGVLPVGQLRDELAHAGFTVHSQQQLPAVSPRLTDVLLETESCA
ncbi:daptide-type RiPP biosynthesis methyltransferase [Streptomyces rimosus]|uniref:daptide-type RiPP biosynthesis methyltransferase n=1 Tax=Streptomyces rimosus TaxID=1927 RepID=UPI0004C4B4F9|nr:daptide-type RiPP biosynthesis methyltransferase [Streptomyces rimosus]